MGFAEKFCMESEKGKLENKNKIVLPDKDYALAIELAKLNERISLMR